MTCHVISTHPMALDDLETFIAFPEGSGIRCIISTNNQGSFPIPPEKSCVFFQEILEVGMVVNHSLVSETNNKSDL